MDKKNLHSLSPIASLCTIFALKKHIGWWRTVGVHYTNTKKTAHNNLGMLGNILTSKHRGAYLRSLSDLAWKLARWRPTFKSTLSKIHRNKEMM